MMLIYESIYFLNLFVQNYLYFAHTLHIMPRPRKDIPLNDVNIRIKGLKTFVNEGKTQEEIAEYYSKKLKMKIDRATISRRIKEMEGD